MIELMSQNNRTDVSEGIDAYKTDGSRECIICHYWYFFMINLYFNQKHVMVAI